VGMLAPFNRVPDYREPGKVNLNTVVGQRTLAPGPRDGPPFVVPSTSLLSSQMWSDVYDGLMHRIRDGNLINTNGTPEVTDNSLITSGHLGPAWRDVLLSRRGYADPMIPAGSATSVELAELVLLNNSPTFFANPFRSPEEGDLVPLPAMVQAGADASMLRSHPYRPGVGLAWGQPSVDEDGNQLVSDARDANPNGDDGPFTVYPAGADAPAKVPLFSDLASTPAIDGTRNSAMHYMPLTRLDNLTTTRSGMFAVWVTVGYFEVLPAPDWDDATNGAQQKFTNQAGGNVDRGRALYNRVYPQGYQLGRELGSDTGDVDRQRAFYIIDRTRPVAFKPGEDVNVEDAILLRRRID
jgi:hypothetical protein